MIPAYNRGIALRGTDPEDLLGSLVDSVRGKAASVYKSLPIRGIKDYDPNKLKRVGRTKQEEDEELEAEEDDEETKARKKKEQKELDDNAAAANASVNGISETESDSASIFAMLFKIVPIGLGVSRRLPNVARGLKNIAQGFAEEVVGLAITSIRLFADWVVQIIYLKDYIFNWIICAIFKLFTLHKCIPFYVLDAILLVMYLAIFSVCFMLDVVLLLKYLFGFGLIDVLTMIFDALDRIDRSIYMSSGIHIFGYPDWIIQMCYRCDILGDTSGITNASKRLYFDYTQLLPRSVLNPLGRIAGGFGDVLSIFNI